MPQATSAMHCQGQVGTKAMQRCVRLEGWEETMLRSVSALTYLHNAQTREKGDGLRNEDVAAVAVPQPAKVTPARSVEREAAGEGVHHTGMHACMHAPREGGARGHYRHVTWTFRPWHVHVVGCNPSEQAQREGGRCERSLHAWMHGCTGPRRRHVVRRRDSA